ncbi:Gfo/Idh/MocA family oxidoreductase [Paenibacillus sp. SYP-B3998]|uniref:Gfo/Idh/MocA family oxidoreductase n=1 Tax=Paenibacillus sp. SYP-B3998 TaxID=2678564 RepID=A0A6G3ZTM3_9BACL|nr:Gfo/Idh/MocA family oxidoreductase [Paenibacillus sp. SYP-B3998]NEW04767.1 Gfo/Idh/MocA family oxidoreductase [Paenibacillus sp. SYP-B3998]
MRKQRIAIIGAGLRGDIYANYALKHPHEVQVVAVAEPNPSRRASFQKRHHIEDAHCHSDWRSLLDVPKLADAVVICTQDQMHLEPAMRALEKDYHVLLEKPMSTTAEACILLGEQADKWNKVFSICHVLRYTPFFSLLKSMLDRGKIGRLISIQHNENVGYWHQAHSFVRGNWRNTKESSPMILAKSCHDLDILLWLAGADCVNIASFGALTHFKAENAPAGAPLRCLDGCPVSDECPYYAPRQYLTANTEWPTAAICEDMSYEARYKALQEGPYGRCVYHCDNDVVDHQVVNMEFANEVTAAFTMTGFTNDCSRTLKLMGTKGEIRASMEKNEIEITYFGSGMQELIRLGTAQGHVGHGGGDDGLMRDFVKLIAQDTAHTGKTAASHAVQSHLMAFAAEQSRLERRVIHLPVFMT